MCQVNDMNREKFLDDLLKKRTLYIEGEVTHEMAKWIGSSILWLNAQDDSSEIILYINSAGGTVTAGLDLYDIVRHSKAPITGIVFRCANSMASIVLQACKTRKALRHSQIVLHNIKTTKEWHEFEENLEKTLHDTKRDQQSIYKILTERTGRTMEEVIKACREAKEMTSEEAKEFGLIDEVI
ncbi:MAG: ATP-dependent Clp protease proteolytic subunit [Nitrospirota bacterium]